MTDSSRSHQKETPTEVEQLRGAVWALADTLARRCLTDANASRDGNEWPAGQTWDELVGTSHSIMRGRAYAEALLDRRTMIELLCDGSGNAKPFATPNYPAASLAPSGEPGVPTFTIHWTIPRAALATMTGADADEILRELRRRLNDGRQQERDAARLHQGEPKL